MASWPERREKRLQAALARRAAPPPVRVRRRAPEVKAGRLEALARVSAFLVAAELMRAHADEQVLGALRMLDGADVFRLHRALWTREAVPLSLDTVQGALARLEARGLVVFDFRGMRYRLAG